MNPVREPKKSEILIYQNTDGRIKIDVMLDEETVWLKQAKLAELFKTSRPNITMHIKNIFDEGELNEDSVCKDFLHTATDGKKYNTKHYNLDTIISVGYRIKSQVATQFRIWATQRLKEYIVKGFVLNDERFKNGSSMNYFNEFAGTEDGQPHRTLYHVTARGNERKRIYFMKDDYGKFREYIKGA